jgi:hypothetical protein
MTSFEVYKLYIGIKLHFTSEYDFVKYKGNTGVSFKAFEKRRDRYFFEKLLKYNTEEIIQFFVSNFVENEDLYIGDLVLNIESETRYIEWKRRVQSISYLFSEDLDNIIDFLNSRELKFDDLFQVKSNEHPILFRFLLQDMISKETFIILNNILNLFEQFDNDIDENYVWEAWRDRLNNYNDFMNFSSKKFKKVLVDKIRRM